MRGYFRKISMPIAKAFGNNRMAVSEIYEDNGGLGQMNTLVMPVFYQPASICPPIHYGVIGVDRPKEIYYDNAVDFKSNGFDLVVQIWNQDLLGCTYDVESRCALQVLRGEEFQCPYPMDEDRSQPKCYGFQDHIYFIDYANLKTMSEALQYCKEVGGELISPRETAERRFLATIVPPDGAWINLTHNGTGLLWASGEVDADVPSQIKIQRTCEEQAWGSFGYFMDPRNFEDNIQCSQAIQIRPPVCRFDAGQVPPVCLQKAVSLHGLICATRT